MFQLNVAGQFSVVAAIPRLRIAEWRRKAAAPSNRPTAQLSGVKYDETRAENRSRHSETI